MKRLIRSSRQLDLILESNPAEDDILRIDDIAWIDDSQGQLATDSTVSYTKIKAARM